MIVAAAGMALPIIASFVKMVLEMRRDLDQAFNKIRELEKRND